MYVYKKLYTMRLNFDYSPDTDISELRAVPGPKAPGLGEFECNTKLGKRGKISSCPKTGSGVTM